MKVASQTIDHLVYFINVDHFYESIIVFFSKLEEKEDEDEKNMELKQIDYLNELSRELQVQRDILQKLSDSISQVSDNETGGLMGASGLRSKLMKSSS